LNFCLLGLLFVSSWSLAGLNWFNFLFPFLFNSDYVYLSLFLSQEL
jgi:hypothetical protein